MAPPRKRKTSVRQRRKQAARSETMPANDVDVTEDDATSLAAKSEPANGKAASPAKGKARKPGKPIPPETWPRKPLAILTGIAIVILALLNAPVAVLAALDNLDGARVYITNFLGLNPFLLAPAVWIAMLLVYKRLGMRRMRFLEAMVMSMMMFFVANTAGQFLIGGVAPEQQAAKPTPSASASAKPSAVSSPSASANSKSAPTATAKPNTKTCPVDNPNCNTTTALTPTQIQEEITAAVLAMLLAIAATIWGYPTVYRWIWGPKKPRTAPAKKK